MVDQHGFGIGILPIWMLRVTGDQEVWAGKAHLEDQFRDGIEAVFLLLKGEVRTDNRRE